LTIGAALPGLFLKTGRFCFAAAQTRTVVFCNRLSFSSTMKSLLMFSLPQVLFSARISAATILFLLLASEIAAQTVYPEPAGLTPSADYEVYVNSKKAFVYASPIPASYCSFDMTGPVDIVIRAARNIRWVDVRPATAGVSATFKDSVIRLRLTKPTKLSIELNGSLRAPLFLFANPPDPSKPDKNKPGVIYFEAGRIHYPGIINLQSDQTLYIEGGAVVVGVVKAVNAHNVKIAGHGVFDGSYSNRFNDSVIRTGDTAKIAAVKAGDYHRVIELVDCSNVTISGLTLHNGTAWQVVPLQCRNVHINGIKILSDQPSDDGIDVVHCQNVLIENCFIRTKDDCVVVKAYMKKTTRPGKDSVLVQRPSAYWVYNTQDVPDVDSVTVQNCTFWNALWGNALEIGFELNAAEVRNVAFRHCDIIHVEAGAALSIHNAGTATVRNVVFEDIRIEDARHKLIDFAIVRSQYSADGTRDPEERKRLYLNGAWDGVLAVPPGKREYHAQFRGRISHVLLKDIHVTGGLFPFSVFYGFDAKHNVSDVTIQNLTVYGKKITSLAAAKLSLENTENIVVK
jgi:hypothetical protein